MKKSANMFFTLTALITLTSFAPKTFWQEIEINRSPASLEDREMFVKMDEELLSPLPFFSQEPIYKTLDAKDDGIKITEKDKIEKLSPFVTEEIKPLGNLVICEQKGPDLEEKVEQLVADNQKLLAELDAIKKTTIDDNKKDKKEKDKKDSESRFTSFQQQYNRADYSSDHMMVISQMTALMFSQQQQQADLMSQMFSMMTNFVPQNNIHNGSNGLERYYSKYSVVPSQESFHSSHAFRLPENDIGLAFDDNPYALHSRNPSNHGRERVIHIQQQPQQPLQVPQPQYSNPVEHDGFNFNFSGTSMSNFDRVLIQ